jgi:hypothetical protein
MFEGKVQEWFLIINFQDNVQIQVFNLPINVMKNSPTVAHACLKRRLKWVLPQVGGGSTGLATLSL